MRNWSCIQKLEQHANEKKAKIEALLWECWQKFMRIICLLFVPLCSYSCNTKLMKREAKLQQNEHKKLWMQWTLKNYQNRKLVVFVENMANDCEDNGTIFLRHLNASEWVSEREKESWKGDEKRVNFLTNIYGFLWLVLKDIHAAWTWCIQFNSFSAPCRVLPENSFFLLWTYCWWRRRIIIHFCICEIARHLKEFRGINQWINEREKHNNIGWLFTRVGGSKKRDEIYWW
jgi:hypothetical protein